MISLSRILRCIRLNKSITRSDTVKDSSYISEYVNSNNFSSQTDYLIWVNLESFKVNIFKGSRNKWTLIHSYLCTIGKPRGTKVIIN